MCAASASAVAFTGAAAIALQAVSASAVGPMAKARHIVAVAPGLSVRVWVPVPFTASQVRASPAPRKTMAHLPAFKVRMFLAASSVVAVELLSCRRC